MVDGDKVVIATYCFNEDENSFVNVSDDEGHNDVLWAHQIAKAIPLWTIPDCLEFLEEKGLDWVLYFRRFKLGAWLFTAEDNKYKKVRREGETRLEACLKAVLAVLEEKS